MIVEMQTDPVYLFLLHMYRHLEMKCNLTDLLQTIHE